MLSTKYMIEHQILLAVFDMWLTILIFCFNQGRHCAKQVVWLKQPHAFGPSSVACIAHGLCLASAYTLRAWLDLFDGGWKSYIRCSVYSGQFVNPNVTHSFSWALYHHHSHFHISSAKLTDSEKRPIGNSCSF